MSEKPEYKPESSPIKYAPSPIFLGLPEYLKDHNNYKKIQKLILNALSSGHSHGEVVEWSTCVKCQESFRNRGTALKKLGFKSPAQYMAWQKTMQVINERVKLR